MAGRAMEMGLVMVLMTMLWSGAMAQPGCSTTLVSLAPCLSFVTGNTSTPSTSCCTQLATVVQNQAQCLCTFLNGTSPPPGLNINQTQALALPGACKVQTPPVSQCNAAAGPASSPAVAPAAAPVTPSTPTATTPSTTPSTPTATTPSTTPSTPTAPTSPSVPSVPSGSGSRTVPSPADAPSAASSTTFSLSIFLFLGLASYASTFTGF